MSDPVLELRNASVIKGDATVLHGLTLHICAGEHTAILGPNGAGKSVLLRLLTHEERALPLPDDASPVRVFGDDNWNVFELRPQLGIVSSDLHQRFVGGNSEGRISGLAAVLSGFVASQGILRYSTVTDEMRRRASDALDKMGAGHLSRRLMNEMSSGEARRVLLARALVTNPRALVLDEPTTGLDVVGRHRFMERVRHIARDGTTIILITHHVEEIIPEIGRVILLRNGRIAADGVKRDMLTERHLSETFGGRMKVEQNDGYLLRAGRRSKLKDGGIMLKHSLVPLVAAVVLTLPAAARAQAFPDGPGKEILEKKCSTCHAPEQVTTFGRSAEEWHEVVVNMIDLGAEVNEEEAKVLVEYLAKNWPLKGSKPAEEKPARREARGEARREICAAGRAWRALLQSLHTVRSVTIREWDVPTPKSRPHDPLAASDGTIWYTGQMVNVLGRLDPKTGQIKEFALKTPASGPHGLTEDKAGNIWYTGNAKGLIGKLDPRTGQVTEYPMPDPAAKDPHSLAFDQKGTLWFTVQGGNMVGKLNPVNGELALRNSPTTRSLPYGIMINSKGVPFFVEFGANKVASIDPATW